MAVTYVPDHANVRSKTLFAATRLTLVRELGTERFRETISATTRHELTADGWRKHDKSGELKAPLTEEEQSLQSVKEAEAEASRGTTSRSSIVSAGRISFPISEDALQALHGLPSGGDNLVQLVRLRGLGMNIIAKLNSRAEVRGCQRSPRACRDWLDRC